MADFDRRSSSPSTSESPSESQSDSVDFSAWCHFAPEDTAASEGFGSSSSSNGQLKGEAVRMDESSVRMLQELLEAQICQPIPANPPIAVNPSVFHLSQSQQQDKTTFVENSSLSSFSSDNSSSDSAPVPELTPPKSIPTAPMSTRVVPPPPVQPRRVDALVQRRTVHPARDACFNLPILTPNIGPAGTKSRVETQVRIALDLAMPGAMPGIQNNYDLVGSWKWLRLPKGTATRKRSRKEGRIDPSPSDTLFLETDVTCASNPSKQVTSCNTCQGREAKRVARKIAARVRPARSDSESNEGEQGSASKIVQFNCSDTMDFSNGTVILPLRITCYCRHHREKVGFNVHFTLKDCDERIVGRGMSPPIMITDDHKSTEKAPVRQQITNSPYSGDADWSSHSLVAQPSTSSSTINAGPPSRRSKEGVSAARLRAKPYNIDQSRKHRFESPESSEQAISSSPAPPATPNESTLRSAYSPFSPAAFIGSQFVHGVSSLPSPSRSDPSSISPELCFSDHSDTVMRDALSTDLTIFPLSPPNTAPPSPPSARLLADATRTRAPVINHDIIYQPGPSTDPLPAPKIHRLIPSSGPTFGGIEVTVLGSNFHPSMVYTCIFGDTVSSSTTRWSENTLVCILPPKATAGVVPVTLEGAKVDPNSAPALFTYLDETDRSLMELALQIVGLKMTGKIEDAKEIAMRIMGGQDGQGGSTSTVDTSASQLMGLAYSAVPDSRRLLMARDDYDFESSILDALTFLDIRTDSEGSSQVWSGISHTTVTGQTLLHLAASRNFSNLVEALIQRDIALDTQDINGYTALHFAVITGSQCCARQLINAGSNLNIISKMGYTALELAPSDFFAPSRAITPSPSEMGTDESEDESHFGDVEEDSGSDRLKLAHKSTHKHRARQTRAQRPSKAASIVAELSDPEDDDNATIVSPESLLPLPPSGKAVDLDEKQVASFADFLQRTWTQLQPTQLRAPPFPQLPGMPAWVFPIFVPMQAWPPFRSEKHSDTKKEQCLEEDGSQTMRAYWDSWLAQMGSAMARQGQMDSSKSAAPSDNPTETEGGHLTVPVAPTPVAPKPSLLRRLGYSQSQRSIKVPEKEVIAFSYKSKSKSLVKKEDRMLIMFWIPILILALAWALYASYPTFSYVHHSFDLTNLTRRFQFPV